MCDEAQTEKKTRRLYHMSLLEICTVWYAKCRHVAHNRVYVGVRRTNEVISELTFFLTAIPSTCI